jgi:hypothetical protein
MPTRDAIRRPKWVEQNSQLNSITSGTAMRFSIPWSYWLRLCVRPEPLKTGGEWLTVSGARTRGEGSDVRSARASSKNAPSPSHIPPQERHCQDPTSTAPFTRSGCMAGSTHFGHRMPTSPPSETGTTSVALASDPRPTSSRISLRSKKSPRHCAHSSTLTPGLASYPARGIETHVGHGPTDSM